MGLSSPFVFAASTRMTTGKESAARAVAAIAIAAAVWEMNLFIIILSDLRQSRRSPTQFVRRTIQLHPGQPASQAQGGCLFFCQATRQNRKPQIDADERR